MSSALDPLRNPMDPLRKTGPDQAHELFKQFSQLASGFSTGDVITAAVNVLINAIRQANPTRRAAEARYNELFGQTKTVLLGHYDSVTGKRKNVFPFTQHIQAQLFTDEDK
jgi:hypothetical protein